MPEERPAPLTMTEITHKLVLALDANCCSGVCEDMFFALVQLIVVMMGSEAARIMGERVEQMDDGQYRISFNRARAVLADMVEAAVAQGEAS
jgi:hypothetical protein